MYSQSRSDVGIDVYQTSRDIGLVEDQDKTGTVQRNNNSLWIVFLLWFSTSSLAETFLSFDPTYSGIVAKIFGPMTILFLVPSIILTVKRFSSRCPWILANTVIEGLHCLSLVLIAICPLKQKPLSRSSNIFIKVILVISLPYVLISWYVMEREREHERAIEKHERAIEKHERAIEERRRYKEVLFKTTFNSVSNTLADAKDTVEENMANAEKLMADTDDMHVEESWTNNEYNEKMAHIDSQLTDLANTVAKLQTLASQMIKLRN